MAVTINGTNGIETNADTGKVKVGADDDLLLQHDGNNSTIDNNTGDLLIRQLGSSGDIYLDPKSGERGVKVIRDGAVELYHSGTKKLESRSGGIGVFGHIEAGDNNKVMLGDANDLQIYHSGSHSYIDDTGTGQLILKSDLVKLQSTGGEDYLQGHENGAVEIYWNGSKKWESDNHGCILTDSTDSDVQIKLVDNGGTCGYLYGSNNDNVGLLDEDGNWRVRVTQSGYQLYGSNLSDRDLKDNITIVSGTSLDKLNKLVVKSYNWKQTNDGHTDTSQTYVGFIAQEVKEQFPTLVTGTDGNKNMAIDYSGLYAHAIKAITELSAEVETLKTKVAALEVHTHE